MFHIFAFAGPAGVGKTTAAHLFAAHFGYSLLGFADPIRETVLQLFPGWGQWHLGPGKDRRIWPRSLAPREALRIIGDHARALQWDIYIRHLGRRIDEERGKRVAGVVVHDLRTDAEATYLREINATLIHLQRDGVAFRADHATEMGIAVEPADLVIRNPGTLDGLRGELLGALCASVALRAQSLEG